MSLQELSLYRRDLTPLNPTNSHDPYQLNHHLSLSLTDAIASRLRKSWIKVSLTV
jgi:hypothetical protein